MHWEYVIAGYGVTFASLALYTMYVLRRGRMLAAKVPVERRRYLG